MRVVSRGLAALAVLLSAALLLSRESPRPPSTQEPERRRIDVVARRFAFEPSEIDVSVGERIELAIKSADGVHGIEIKQLKIKRQIPRGDTAIRIEFTAPAAGRYPIVCSEYCGANHEDMKGALVVRAGEPTSP
jgi:cytochrome c oxidase subunit II